MTNQTVSADEGDQGAEVEDVLARQHQRVAT